MTTLDCSFGGYFHEKPLNSKDDEDSMVASFFDVQTSVENESRGSAYEARGQQYSQNQEYSPSRQQSPSYPNSRQFNSDWYAPEHQFYQDPRYAFDDELLNRKPEGAASRITVYTRDASLDSVYEQQRMASEYRVARRAQQKQRMRTQQEPESRQQGTEYCSSEDTDFCGTGADAGGNQHHESNAMAAPIGEAEQLNSWPSFVSADGFSDYCAQRDDQDGKGEPAWDPSCFDGVNLMPGATPRLDITKSLSAIEELPMDEYDVVLSDDGIMRDMEHRMPAQRKAMAAMLMAKRQRRSLRCFAAAALLLVIGVGTYLYLEFVKNGNLANRGGGDTRLPTQEVKDEMVASPSFAPAVQDMLEAKMDSEAYQLISPKVDNPSLLLDQDTPQGRAFDLVYQEELMKSSQRALQAMPWEDEYRIIQRYALMVFFFSTEGEDRWRFKTGWSGFDPNECDWWGIEECGRNKEITNLRMERFRISGAIPNEICLLTAMHTIMWKRNVIRGSIPDCLATMPNLRILDLQQNKLTGTIPRQFFLSDVMQRLYLSRNELTGSIDVPAVPISRTQFKSYQNMKEIRLDNNKLSGEVGDAFMFYAQLETLTLHNNDIVGGIDAICVHPLKELTADCREITCTCCTQCYQG